MTIYIGYEIILPAFTMHDLPETAEIKMEVLTSMPTFQEVNTNYNAVSRITIDSENTTVEKLIGFDHEDGRFVAIWEKARNAY